MRGEQHSNEGVLKQCLQNLKQLDNYSISMRFIIGFVNAQNFCGITKLPINGWKLSYWENLFHVIPDERLHMAQHYTGTKCV